MEASPESRDPFEADFAVVVYGAHQHARRKFEDMLTQKIKDINTEGVQYALWAVKIPANKNFLEHLCSRVYTKRASGRSVPVFVLGPKGHSDPVQAPAFASGYWYSEPDQREDRAPQFALPSARWDSSGPYGAAWFQPIPEIPMETNSPCRYRVTGDFDAYRYAIRIKSLSLSSNHDQTHFDRYMKTHQLLKRVYHYMCATVGLDGQSKVPGVDDRPLEAIGWLDSDDCIVQLKLLPMPREVEC